MSEPDDRMIEAVVAFSAFEAKVKDLGLQYDLHAAFWDQTLNAKAMSASSDPIAKQRLLHAAILADGSARLIESKKTVYPPNADLNPQNARIVQSNCQVHYSENGIINCDLFHEFSELFQVGTKNDKSE